MVKDNCVFCKILRGEIPSYKIYEDEHTFAFLDIAKDVDGHTLVIPKAHHENIPSETYACVMDTVKMLANHYVENCGYEGVNILNASGKAAGQTVFHLHFHLFPRKSNDKADLCPKNQTSTISLEEMHSQLKIK